MLSLPTIPSHPTPPHKLPFIKSIKGGLQEGSTITVTGRVKPEAKRFHVDLQCSSYTAFHFNPRYNKRPGNIVFNTYQRGWGSEEIHKQELIPPGTEFTLVFQVKRDAYLVTVNGHSLEYVHRLSFQNVDSISVDGEIELHSVHIQNPSHTEEGCLLKLLRVLLPCCYQMNK
ncbi:hypothetical protein AGOR_G00029590 [Albula goreensis]|uniref:Galectin n=1 Tax=Albula goreensis TaxID=1534307 RepID=A0A8T3E4U0_9TELE|nr:hypothetical protein AGOR_G00029590 [Albula goreensis]